MMRSKMRKYGWCLLAGTLLMACSKVPDEILSEKKMQAVLTDMMLAEAMVGIDYNTYRSDTMKLSLYESVFRKHGITRELYDSSLVWYGKNLDIYMKVYDRVADDLNERVNNLGDVQADAVPASNRDSVNIWPRRPYLVLSPKAVFNGVIFDIRPETNYSSGSSFVLGMHVWGLDRAKTYKPEIRLCADQVDTTIIVNDRIQEDGYHEVVLKTVPTQKIKRVFGYIRMDNRDSVSYKIYVDDLSLMKYNYGKDIQSPKDSVK